VISGIVVSTSLLYYTLPRFLGLKGYSGMFKLALLLLIAITLIYVMFAGAAFLSLLDVNRAPLILAISTPLLFLTLIIFLFLPHPVFASAMFMKSGGSLKVLVDGVSIFKKHLKSLILAQLKVYVVAGLPLWAILTLASLAIPLRSQVYIIPITWFDILDILGRDVILNALIAREMVTFFTRILKRTLLLNS